VLDRIGLEGEGGTGWLGGISLEVRTDCKSRANNSLFRGEKGALREGC